MKYIVITLVVLCAAVFVTLDAASVLPSSYEAEFEAVRRQQSDEMAKIFLDVFSRNLTTASDGIGRDGSIQGDSDSEIWQIVSNVTINFLSALSKSAKTDPGRYDEVGQTFIKGIDSILSAVKKQHCNEIVKTIFKAIIDLLSATSRKADPNDEMMQTLSNGFKTIFSLLGKIFVNGGEIQCSNCEMNQAFISSFISGVRKQINCDKVQSDRGEDFVRTSLNVFKFILSANRRNSNPNDEALQTLFDACDTLLSLMGRFFGNFDNEGDEILLAKGMLKYWSQFLSALTKRFGNSELARSFFNGLSMILSAVGQKMINGGRESQIQFSSELPGAVLNLLGNVGSALQKKASTENEAAQEILSLFNTGAKNGIGGGQEIHIYTPPTYTSKQFDQSMSPKLVDEDAVVVEADMDLTDEAKTQLWGAVLSSLASSVLDG